jgi:hypothetical protein
MQSGSGRNAAGRIRISLRTMTKGYKCDSTDRGSEKMRVMEVVSQKQAVKERQISQGGKRVQEQAFTYSQPRKFCLRE